MAFVEAKTLKGFHDKLPKEALAKERMIGTLKGVFQSYGYVPIETPHLEYLEVLVHEASGQEIQKQVFRFTDQGGREVGLRFDLTVPLARFIVQHKAEVGVPFKRYAIGNVFRGEKPQAGRYREFTQCDFDFVGTNSLSADAEIVQVIVSCLEALGINNFVVKVNNRKILNGVLESLDIKERSDEFLREIDKLDKIGEKGVGEALSEQLRLSSKQVEEIFSFLSLRGNSSSETIDAINKHPLSNGTVKEGAAELKEIAEIVSNSGVEKTKFSIDLSIARGLGYYTGCVYETSLTNNSSIGSVASGGRYDNLTKTFSKDDMPGVGCSIGLDRLIAGLEEIGALSSTGTPAKVLLIQESSSQVKALHNVASTLRKLGVPSEIYPNDDKVKKQFDYAERYGHPYLLFEKNGELRLRNTASREDKTFSNANDIAEVLKKA